MTPIVIRDLSFRRGAKPILDGVHLDVASGEIFCILGRNGAGKSTLLHCLLGLLAPESGEIHIFGDRLAQLSRIEVARRIAFVPQASQAAFAFTVAQLVLMGRMARLSGLGAPKPLDRRKADEAMARVGIAALREKPITQLSGGERQLALIARALAQEAPILVMDEPTAGLDLGNQGRILALNRDLARDGATIVMTSHLPDQAFNLRCKVGLLKQGRFIAAGPVKKVCGTEAMNELYDANLWRLDAPEAELVAYLPRLD